MGRTAYSRRVIDAGLGHLRENDFPLDAQGAERSGPSQTLAHLLAESPGMNRGDGFLHGPNSHVRCPLLLVRHRPRAPTCTAFQRYTPSDQYLDRATVAGSVPIPTGTPVSHLRSRCQVGVGGLDRGSLDGYSGDSNLIPESLAEWDRGAVG